MRKTIAISLIALGLCALPRTGHAQVPEGMTFDDAFTFYEMVDHQDHVDGHAVDAGWALKGQFRVFGHTSQRSSFKMVIKKGRRTLGEVVCEVDRENWSTNIAEGPDAFFTRNCLDREQRITENGDIDVLVYYIDDDTDEEVLLRTHHLRVVDVTRVRGNGDPDAPLHYADRNGEALLSVMHLQHDRENPYFEAVGGRRLDSYSGRNVVTLLVNLSPDEDHGSIGGNLRCKVNGERVAIESDELDATEIRRVYLIHTHDRGRRDEREIVNFRQVILTLPLSFHEGMVTPTFERWRPLERFDESLTYMDQHPGEWECQWRENRAVLRTFRWTVTEDGHMAVHPEQTGGLSIGPNAYFVATEIPDGGSGYESRLERAAAEGRPFYGLGWHSDEGRALGHAVPNVGTPTPPQPRGRGRRGRGRRGRRGRH